MSIIIIICFLDMNEYKILIFDQDDNIWFRLKSFDLKLFIPKISMISNYFFHSILKY